MKKPRFYSTSNLANVAWSRGWRDSGKNNTLFGGRPESDKFIRDHRPRKTTNEEGGKVKLPL